MRRRAKNLFLSGAFLLMLTLPGCVQREKVYYLPKEDYPQIERKDSEAELPMEEKTEDSDSVVLPFVPFETEESK